MRIIIYILIIFLLSCHTEETKTVFDSLKGQAEVEIILNNYKLDSIPPEINVLKGIKKLYISKDSSQGWTVYPPLSALGQNKENTPLRHLPKQITELTTLKSLALINLDLVTLPEDINKLQNLDTLILYMNKLKISDEIEKLKGLKKLKYLGLLGNDVTANDLITLEKVIPGITINPALK